MKEKGTLIMREHRVTKGWVHVATNDMAFGNTETKQERVRREHRFNQAIRAIKVERPEYDIETGKTTASNLMREGAAAHAEKVARKESLVDAFKNKKLKSKSLIREAKGYVKKPAGKQKAS